MKDVFVVEHFTLLPEDMSLPVEPLHRRRNAVLPMLGDVFDSEREAMMLDTVVPGEVLGIEAVSRRH